MLTIKATKTDEVEQRPAVCHIQDPDLPGAPLSMCGIWCSQELPRFIAKDVRICDLCNAVHFEKCGRFYS